MVASDMNGIYLQGGGAKGAFEAGALYRLWEEEIPMNLIAGTSIGAINGYFVYTNSFKEMKQFYKEYDGLQISKKIKIDDVIENDTVMEVISNLLGRNKDVESFMVNYVHVEAKQCKEVSVDLVGKSQRDMFKAIKASSLLPFSKPLSVSELTLYEAFTKYPNRIKGAYFEKDVKAGKYNKCDLDGGVLNNNFWEPFLDRKVKTIYAPVLYNNYIIPEQVRKMYPGKKIVLIEPKTIFQPTDSLKFTQPFMSDLFDEGYEAAKNRMGI